MSDEVSVRTELPGVAVVTLHRPPANFIDVELMRELAEAVESVGDHRVAVLAGEGKHFCAGAKLSPTGRLREAGSSDGAHLYDHAIRLFEQPIPLVAAVHGAAIGAGLGMALAADFRVGCAGSRFAASFAQLGFHPGFGISETLPRVVGRQLATELLYTGRRVSGAEALRIGLVDRFAEEPPADPSDDFGAGAVLAEALDLARQIAASAPLAVRSIRQTQRAGLADAVRAIMEREKAEQERLSETADYREGVAATAERRPPNFVGA
jgi:enoyl-CoA hydratase/carnithine racemase